MSSGSPFAPHTEEMTATMLSAMGVEEEDALFDIPEAIEYDAGLDIDAKDEAEVAHLVERLLGRNEDLTAFLGRGHYDHHVPAVVDALSSRSEFLTSYTQYQPEVAQGFLQALFEYQSMLVELTGLPIANASMYDAASALGEAALLATRVRETDGSTVLVPENVREERVSVLENYIAGHGLAIERIGTEEGTVDLEALRGALGPDTLFVYAESPTAYGTIEERLGDIADLAHAQDAMFGVGSDPVALSLLEPPGALGADVVIGDASVLGLPTSYGMGLGLFATKESYLRQVPGRLVGVGEDADGKRAYTLTLQTREQHIRRERATSNICTNQAWVALRTAMHAAWLGPDGLVELAEDLVELPRSLASQLDQLAGVTAPVFDRHHFREFVARTDQPAPAIATDLEAEGFAVHALGDHRLQICVTETTADATEDLVAAMREVIA
ncbi:MAG: aminomethyl-transferring glycine dehydrogenase subunit GcvPA [Halodesulfurarchaeum sp.]